MPTLEELAAILAQLDEIRNADIVTTKTISEIINCALDAPDPVLVSAAESMFDTPQQFVEAIREVIAVQAQSRLINPFDPAVIPPTPEV